MIENVLSRACLRKVQKKLMDVGSDMHATHLTTAPLTS